MATHESKELPGLSDLEREVMEVVWAAEAEVSVKQVAELVNAGTKKQRAYTTFMTILSRLHKKKIVERRRVKKSDLYKARVGKTEYLETRARTEIDALVGEYGDIALAQFARQVTESSSQDERLKKLADGTGTA